jgi:dipeptidyl-peptidase-4
MVVPWPPRRALVASLVLCAAAPGCRGEGRSVGGASRGAEVAVSVPLGWPAFDERALLALQQTERFELGTPVPLAITPDGAVLFRRAKPRDRVADLYQIDAAGKIAELAVAAALVTGGGDLGGGIETIELSDDGARVLVPLAGRLFALDRTAGGASGAARELPVGAHRDPRLSPDGKRVAFVRDGDLWVLAIGEARPVRIAQHPAGGPADQGALDYATPDGAARAFGRDRGLWWSPDSQSIAFERSDARAVAPLYVAEPRHPDRAPAASRIALAGKPIAAVDLGIASVRGGAPRWIHWDTEHYPYLARVIWPAHGPLTVLAVGRTQTVAAVITVDAKTAAAQPVLVEKDAAWVNLPPDGLAWLPDGSGFLWMTEASGAWSLERHAADGAHVATVMTADAGVRRIVAIAPDGRDAIVEASPDPREQHVLRVALAGGAPTALTSGGGVHTARAGYGVVAISSQLRAGGRAVSVMRAGGQAAPLPSVAERPPTPTTQIESVALDDHAQFAAITRAHAFDPKVRYPVLLRLGTAIDARSVLDAIDSYIFDQWYADAGIIVVRTDGRGTGHGDRSWQRAIAGDVLTIPMNDQIGALVRLGARHPELDLGRVGVIGSEQCGDLAALAVLLHPDDFAAAVAVSPITDWALVDSATAERYLKTPEQNAEGYRRTSAATYAEQLTRPLLLLPAVPGSQVSIAQTFALIDALSSAGKHAEIASWPDRADAAHRVATTRLVLDFLRERLGPPVRPSVMPAARTGDEDEEAEERERARRGSAAGSSAH